MAGACWLATDISSDTQVVTVTGGCVAGILSSFMSQRIAVASDLREGKCGGAIDDAILILSGAISAIASEV